MSNHAQRRDVDRYDQWAKTYEDSKIQKVRNEIHHNLQDWISGAGIEPTRILDVGCGTGMLLHGLASRFPDAEAFGIDIAPSMIEEAKAKVTSEVPMTFVQAPAEHLPFDDGEFDLVVSTICFHHWHSRAEGLAEVRRVLAPGGRFYLADHFAIGWLRPFFAITMTRSRVHTPPELDRLMAGAGLSIADWKLLYKLGGRLPLIHGVLAQARD